MRKGLYIIICCFQLLWGFRLHAIEVQSIVLEDALSVQNVTAHVHYVLTDREISVQDFKQDLEFGRLDVLNTSRFKLGCRMEDLWLGMRVQNLGQVQGYTLRFNGGVLSREVEVYLYDEEGQVLDAFVGTQTHLQFYWDLEPERTYSIFVKIKGKGKWTESSIFLEQTQARLEWRETRGWLMGVFYGVFIFIALWNLVYYIALREITFLFYGLFSFFVFCILMYFDGHAYNFFFPEHVHDQLNIFCQRMAVGTSFCCAISLVKYKFDRSFLSWFIRGYFIYDLIFVSILQLCLPPEYYYLFFALVPISAVLVAVVILIVIRNGEPALRGLIWYYLAAYAVLGIGVLLLELQFMQVLNFEFPTNAFPKVAFFVDVIMTSFAVGKGMKIQREQRLLKQQEMQLLEREYQTVKYKNLQLQLSPHFFFNTLNAIRNLILDKEIEVADQQLMKFSSMARSMLEDSRVPFIPWKREQQFLEDYLEMQRMRFEFKFTYSFHVQPDLDPEVFHLPPMLLQPFIENAVEHGKLHQVEAGHVRVEVERVDGGGLQIQIQDNGIGLEASQVHRENKHKSLGIELLQDRVTGMCKAQGIAFDARFEIEDRTLIGDRGTAVTLVLPYVTM